MQFFTLKALEIFKFEVFQQICCSFYCFRNMKRLKGNDAHNFYRNTILIGYSLTYVKMIIIFSKNLDSIEYWTQTLYE